MDVESSVREFLKDQVAVQEGKDDIATDESLLDSGVLDSASILELVSFLEERFSFTIDDEELVPENFETVDSIVSLVTSKKEAQPAGGDAAS
jgi:methoxymalonate biosynthesis acyl carrier protein